MSNESTTANATENYNEWADKAVRIVAKNAMVATGHRMVGTPHILLGILKEGPAANLLNRSFGVRYSDVAEVTRGMSKPLPQGIGAEFMYTDGAKATLDTARELAQEYGFRFRQVYTEHLLAALLKVNDPSLQYVFSALNVDYDGLAVKAMHGLEWKAELVSH